MSSESVLLSVCGGWGWVTNPGKITKTLNGLTENLSIPLCCKCRSMTKPTKWHVRPDWVFAFRMKKPWVLSYPIRTAKTLIRLGGCPDWSESSLGAQVIVLSSLGAQVILLGSLCCGSLILFYFYFFYFKTIRFFLPFNEMIVCIQTLSFCVSEDSSI